MSRRLGAYIFGPALLVATLELALAVFANKVSPLLIVLTPSPLLVGLYMLIVGEPLDPTTLRRPAWIETGLLRCLAAGVVIGVAIVVVITFWFSGSAPVAR